MTIYDMLVKLTGGMTGLIELLQKIEAEYPDLAAKCDEWITALQGAASQANLVALASALPGEIANIAQGDIQPHDHASDAI